MCEESMISVIVPCYNCENTINQTLQSIENQSYKNIEIILIDDGSRDDTLLKLNELKKNSLRKVIIYHQDNQGVSVARNKGLEIATGKYVAFIDADDAFAIDALQIMIDAYVDGKSDVAYSFFSRNRINLENNAKPRVNGELFHHMSINDAMHIIMNEKYRLGFTTFLFKREIIREHNITFPVGLKTGEDLEFLWHYLIYCKMAVEINRFIYWYYDNPQSAVHKVEWSRTDSYNSISRIKKLMEENGCDYAIKFSDYMSARYLWSYAKTFSVGNRKDLFNRLAKEYETKQAMTVLIKKCPDIRVRLTSFIYLLNKDLFFYAVRAIGR